MTYPDGTTEILTYSPTATLERPLTFTDRRGLLTAYTYDARGNLLTETDPLGRVTSYTYSTAGLLTSKTIPGPNNVGTATTAYTYNSDGSETSSLASGLPNRLRSIRDSTVRIVQPT